MVKDKKRLKNKYVRLAYVGVVLLNIGIFLATYFLVKKNGLVDSLILLVFLIPILVMDFIIGFLKVK